MKNLKSRLLILTFIVSGFMYSQHTSFEVNISGKGIPILLFPGFSCPGSVWNDVVTELSKTNECHVFTFAGFGDVPAIETPWLPKIKEDIITYISDNNLKQITLIGHSLGGTLSLWLGTENTLNLKTIITVDALPSIGALMMPNFDSKTIVYDNPYNKQLLDMSDENFEAMATQMASGMVINESKKEIIKDWIVETDRETYVYGYTDLLKLDLRTDISKITTPLVVLAAVMPYGLETVKKTYQEQYKNHGHYKIKLAERSAHFIMYDQPQ